MKVSVKGFQVRMEVGNNGIELDVYDHDIHLGDLRIGKATIEWCPGRTRKGNGAKKRWEELIAFFNA